jgi:hypothetical protein
MQFLFLFLIKKLFCKKNINVKKFLIGIFSCVTTKSHHFIKCFHQFKLSLLEHLGTGLKILHDNAKLLPLVHLDVVRKFAVEKPCVRMKMKLVSLNY